VDLRLARQGRAGLVVRPLRVAAVDDRVVGVQQLDQRLDGLLRRIAGGHHDPDRSRWFERLDQFPQARGAAGAGLLGARDRLWVEVERDNVMVGVAADPRDHVAAHLSQPDESDLHQSISLTRV
jgi:hypothetical protein